MESTSRKSIYPYDQHLLSTCCVPGPVLDPGYSVGQTDKNPLPDSSHPQIPYGGGHSEEPGGYKALMSGLRWWKHISGDNPEEAPASSVLLSIELGGQRDLPSRRGLGDVGTRMVVKALDTGLGTEPCLLYE